jgi:hypothetical protein
MNVIGFIVYHNVVIFNKKKRIMSAAICFRIFTISGGIRISLSIKAVAWELVQTDFVSSLQ